MLHRYLKKPLLCLAYLSIPAVANAGVVFYDDFSDFDNAITTVVVEDFESFAPISTPVSSVLTSDGITYTGEAGVPFHNVFVTPPGITNYGVTSTSSHVMSARGDENILMSFNSPIFAFGFDTYLNLFGPAEITVYGLGGSVLDTYSHNHAANQVGFLGITSDMDITAVRFETTMGAVVNTGIDNIRLATAIIPEPNPYFALLLGLGMISIFRREKS